MSTAGQLPPTSVEVYVRPIGGTISLEKGVFVKGKMLLIMLLARLIDRRGEDTRTSDANGHLNCEEILSLARHKKPLTRPKTNVNLDKERPPETRWTWLWRSGYVQTVVQTPRAVVVQKQARPPAP